MKSFTSALIIIASSTLFSNAATTLYTFRTNTGTTNSGITNSAGLQFQNNSTVAFASAGPGSVAFGYFSITDSAISAATSASTLTTAFQNWNGTTTSTFNSPGATQQRGTFSVAAAARDMSIGTGIPFAGKNMYAFVGNGTTFALSTEFLVLKTTFTFDSTQSGITAFTNTITAGTSDGLGGFTGANATVLLGNTALDVRTTSADSSATPGWRTATLIPEPSAALLGAVGALVLLRRRRI